MSAIVGGDFQGVKKLGCGETVKRATGKKKGDARGKERRHVIWLKFLGSHSLYRST